MSSRTFQFIGICIGAVVLSVCTSCGGSTSRRSIPTLTADDDVVVVDRAANVSCYLSSDRIATVTKVLEGGTTLSDLPVHKRPRGFDTGIDYDLVIHPATSGEIVIALTSPRFFGSSD